MTNHPTTSYQHASALGASPIGAVISLYDAILRDLRQALNALEAGQIELRIEKTNHALTIIGYLESVLDHERGGEAAQRLDRFYRVTRGLIVKANFAAAPKPFEELIDLFSRIRQAWYQADQQLTVKQPEPQAHELRGRAAETAVESQSYEDAEVVQSHWST